MNYQKIKKYTLKNHSIIVEWDNGKQSEFDYLFLRDNCSTAFHPSTKERNFNLLSVSENIKPKSVNINTDSLDILWDEQDHQSTYQFLWLIENDYSQTLENSSEKIFHSKSWDHKYASNIYQVNCDQIIQNDQDLLDWLIQLHSLGLVLVNNMPQQSDALESVAKKISHLRETNFGVVFDVQSKPNPNNQAYTSEALPLHTDLPNQELPPGFQFLHCVENQSTGGESTFVDGFAVAEYIQTNNPEAFQILSEQAIPFRFHDQTVDLIEQKTVISLLYGKINEINYNAHLSSTFRLDKKMMRQYYLAYRYFMETVKQPQFLVQFKLESNQMVVFDNRRVLHGRTEFDPNTGKRHLRGCYIDRGDLKSKIRKLQNQ